MKLRKVLVIAVLSGIAFTSCKNNEREDDSRAEMDRMEAERDAEMRSNERMDENSIAARIRENENLSTFSESMNRNQITQSLESNNAQGTTTGQGTTGTTSDRNATGEGTTGTSTAQSQGTTTAGSGQGTTTGEGSTATTTGEVQGTNATQGEGIGTGRSYTIFAPSNDAYESLSEAQRKEILDTQKRERNTAAMNYLMVEQRLTIDELKRQIKNGNGTYTIKTMQGENLIATLDGDNVVLKDTAGNQARITESDDAATDGVVHVIDKVLMPSDPGKNEAANRTGTNNTSTPNKDTKNQDSNKTSTGTTSGTTETEKS